MYVCMHACTCARMHAHVHVCVNNYILLIYVFLKKLHVSVDTCEYVYK